MFLGPFPGRYPWFAFTLSRFTTAEVSGTDNEARLHLRRSAQLSHELSVDGAVRRAPDLARRSWENGKNAVEDSKMEGW